MQRATVSEAVKAKGLTILHALSKGLVEPGSMGAVQREHAVGGMGC